MEPFELDEIECIHGKYECDERDYIERTQFNYTDPDRGRMRTRTCRCSYCGNLLYTQRIDGYTGKTVYTEYEDEIYALLYTKNGRAKLLKHACENLNIPLPAYLSD